MAKNLNSLLSPRRIAMLAVGNLILAFGLYNVHAHTSITEGGVLGMTLLLNYWFGISPAYSSLVLDVVCFAFGVKVLGRDFLRCSVVATLVFSAAYRIFECFPPLWPALGQYPGAAAVLGAVFVGVGVGLSVRAGGAAGGDDALAMALQKLTKIDIQWLYLITDLIVLLLSLTYIPLARMVWSFVTVILSGQIIGWMQKLPAPPDIK